MTDKELLHLASRVRVISEELVELSGEVGAVASFLRISSGVAEAPWVDVVGQMPTNPKAPNPKATPGVWAKRTKDQVTGITIHHTLSQDPIATARYITTQKGLPTTEYAIWVAENGESLLCVPLDIAFWHDNTGYPNHHISIGLAGDRRKGISDDQLDGLVRVVWHLLREYGLPFTAVRGHDSYLKTECPGWEAGGWMSSFFNLLESYEPPTASLKREIVWHLLPDLPEDLADVLVSCLPGTTPMVKTAVYNECRDGLFRSDDENGEVLLGVYAWAFRPESA